MHKITYGRTPRLVHAAAQPGCCCFPNVGAEGGCAGRDALEVERQKLTDGRVFGEANDDGRHQLGLRRFLVAAQGQELHQVKLRHRHHFAPVKQRNVEGSRKAVDVKEGQWRNQHFATVFVPKLAIGVFELGDVGDHVAVCEHRALRQARSTRGIRQNLGINAWAKVHI